MFKNHNQNKIIILLLLLSCLVFFLFAAKEINRIDNLFSYDPLFHLNIAKNVDIHDPLATHYETFEGNKIKLNYPSLLRLTTITINEATGISYIQIYKYLGLIFRILTALALFIVIRYISKSSLAGYFATLLFLSSHYVFYRSIITYPENLALLFHVLILYELLLFLKEDKLRITLPILFSLTMLVHYPSVIIPVFLLVLTLIIKVIAKVKSKDFKSFFLGKKFISTAIIFIVIFLILTAPVINSMISKYTSYLNLNVGNTELSDKIGTSSRYVPPAYASYIKNLGILLAISLVLSLAIILTKYRNKESLLIVIWLLFTFFLTRGTQFNVLVPSDRMQIYFIIPSVIASGYLFKYIFSKFNFSDLKTAMIFPIFVLLIFVTTVSDVHGWQGISNAEIESCSWANYNINKDSLVVFKGYKYVQCGISNYERVETRQKVSVALNKKDYVSEIFSEQYDVDQLYLLAKISSLTAGQLANLKSNEVVFENKEIYIFKIILN